MAKTIIEADPEDVVVKKACKGSNGAYGVVYCPKAWIGRKVLVVLDRGKEAKQ